MYTLPIPVNMVSFTLDAVNNKSRREPRQSVLHSYFPKMNTNTDLRENNKLNTSRNNINKIDGTWRIQDTCNSRNNCFINRRKIYFKTRFNEHEKAFINDKGK